VIVAHYYGGILMGVSAERKPSTRVAANERKTSEIEQRKQLYGEYYTFYRSRCTRARGLQLVDPVRRISTFLWKAWKRCARKVTSVDGSPNAGTITFEQLWADRTMTTAIMEYEPEGFFEKTGDALEIPSGRIEGDLKRFRDYVEARGRESGGWRGQIGAEHELSEGTASPQPRETAGENTIEVPLSQEEVKVGKRTVAAGEVRVRKTVSTEQVNVPVELKREDAVIERISAHEVG
jgi:uncharacterized protein DUF2382